MTAQPPHVIISFDMETDLGNRWTTYEAVHHGTPAILAVLERNAAPATSCMAPYLPDRRLPAFFCLYLHPWEFVPTPHELVFGEGRLGEASWLCENSGAAHRARWIRSSICCAATARLSGRCAISLLPGAAAH